MPRLLPRSTSVSPLPPRHWKAALTVFLASFGLVLVTTVVLPNRYKSQMKILLRNERINPLVSLNEQTTGLLYLDQISEERVNTETALLTSTSILRDVVKTCHLDRLVHGANLTRQKRDDLALRSLQHSLSVSAMRKSSIINVSYESRDPDTAALVLGTLGDLYLRAHVQLYSAPGSSSVFRELAHQYADKLMAAQQSLVAFQQTHNIVALPKEKELALANLNEAQKLLVGSYTSQKENQEQAAALRSSLAALPPNLVMERKESPNQYSVERLNTLLVDLRNQRTQRAMRYEPGDRQLQELDNQIAQTQAALDAAAKSVPQEVTTSSNPSQLAAEQEWIHISAQAAGNGAATAALLSEIRNTRARLAVLDQETAHYDTLQEQVKQMDSLSQMYRFKAEESAANEVLDRQRIANVAIAEQPFRSSIPSSPRRGLILGLGFVWSVIAGAGTFFGLTRSDRFITEPAQLEKILPSPLLASLTGGAQPFLYSDSVRELVSSVHDGAGQFQGKEAN